MTLTKPTISWEAIVSESTAYTGAYNYTCKLTKNNPNDPGYGDLQIGYYIVDFVGHIFEITGINYGGDSEAVIVHDLLERDEENGPYGLRESYVYSSLAQAATVAQAKLNRLDESAEDFVRSLGLDPALVNAVQFNTTHVPDSVQEGLVYWNTNDNTINVATGYGSVLQVGQEIHIKVYNNSGGTIPDGTAVYPTGAFNDYPTIGKARTDTHETVAVDYGMTTTSMDDGEYGFVAWFGKVRGLDTSIWNLGDRLWISPDNPGEMVNVQPTFPDYAVQIGIVFIKDALDGQIFVTSRDTIKDTIQNFWNGVFRESFDFRISSNGTTITGLLEPNDGHDDMTMMFSDGFTLLDTSPAATITLTPGTADIPQQNYIYIPQSTKVLTVSTSDWPTTVEHIKVAQVLLRTAVLTQEEGALRNQNWNDHLQCTTTGQGHLSHMGERMRQNDSKWESGVEGSVVIDTGAVYAKNTSGVVYQMHRQSFPLIDMTQYTIDAVSQGSKTFTISGDGDLTSVFPDGRLIKINGSTGNDAIYTIVSTNYADPNFVITVEESIASAVVDGTIGDIIHIVNHDTTPYISLIDLATVVNDASSNALNNSSFSIVVWGVQNKTGEESQLMANLPTNTYSKNFPQQSVDDAFNYSVYDIPKAFQGVGFLIARFTFVNTAGVWTLYDTEDLRGKTPNTTAGGGAGGAGVTSFLGLGDTPSAYTAQGEKLIQVNAAETALEFITDIKTDSINEYTASNGILLGNTLTVDQSNNRVILPQNNTPLLPALTIGTTNSGLYGWTNDVISMSIGGTLRYSFNSAASLGLYNGSASINFNDQANIIINASDQLNFNGASGGYYFDNNVEINKKLTVGTNLSYDTTEGLWFGDGDTGFYEIGDDEIAIAIAGIGQVMIKNTVVQGGSSNNFAIRHSQGLSATVPHYTFRDEWDTGIGLAGADQLSHIAGGVEGIRVGVDALTFYHDSAFSESVTITGNLTVNGTYFTNDVQTMTIADNLAIINFGETGNGITEGFAGWEVDRGTFVPYRWGYNEVSDSYELGEYYTELTTGTITGGPFTLHEEIIQATTNAKGYIYATDNTTYVRLKGTTGTFNTTNLVTGQTSGATFTPSVVADTDNLQPVATREDTPTADYYAQWDDTNKRFNTVSANTILGDADNYWVLNGTDLYYTGGQVGIGLSDPDADLTIKSAGVGYLLKFYSSGAGYLGGFYQTATGDGDFIIGNTGGVPTVRFRADGNDNYINAGDLLIANNLKVDTISEYATDVGVTIDSVLIKDGRVTNSTDAAPSIDAELANKKYVDDQITGGSFTNYGTDNQIPYMNGTTDFSYSDNFTYDGSTFHLKGTTIAYMKMQSGIGYDNLIGFTNSSGIHFYLGTDGNENDFFKIARSGFINNDFVIDSVSGEVGINTNVPDRQLDVSGTGRFTGALTVITPTSDYHASTKKYVDDNITSPMVYPGAGIALSTGSAWGTSITNNSSNWNTAYTHSQVTTGNPHSLNLADIGETYADINYWVLTGSDIYYNTGNIGIGTNSPGEKLEVSGSILSKAAIARIKLYDTDTNKEFQLQNNSLFKLLETGTGLAPFIVEYGAPSNSIYIKSDGAVGIGTSSPDKLLQLTSTGTTTFKIGSTTNQDPRIMFNTSASSSSDTVGAIIQVDRTNVGGAGSTDLIFSATLATTYYERMRILANGNVGIGNTSPSYKLDVNGTGRFTSTVTATNFILSSDIRLKENIVKANILELPEIKEFTFKSDKTKRLRRGVIAQELEKSAPEMVHENAEGFKQVDYTDFLLAKIANLENRLNKLERDNI